MSEAETSTNFWEYYRQQLTFFVLKRVNDPLAAEDIVQDVLLKVFTKRDQLRDDDKLRSWLFQITRNAIVDYYRAKEQDVPLTAALPAAIDRQAEAEDVRREFAEGCVRPLISQLPEPYQEAVTLSELEGLTQTAVAQRQGISLSGAKSRVQRGRQLLKGKLLQCCQLEFSRNGQLTDYKPQDECNGC